MAGSSDRWTCAPCKRKFVSSEARAMHLLRSSRHSRCKPCKRGFIDEDSRHQHIRAFHANTYCSLCDRTFKDGQALLQHRRGAAVHLFVAEHDSDSSDDVSQSIRSNVSAAAADSGSDIILPSSPSSHVHTEFVESVNHLLAWEPTPATAYDRWISTMEDDDSSSAGDDSSYFNPISDEQESEEESSNNESVRAHPSSDSDSNTNTDTDTDTDADADTDTDTDTDDSESSLVDIIPSNERSRSSSSSRGSVSRQQMTTFASRALLASSSSDTLASEPIPDSRPASTKPSKRAGSGYTCPLCLDQDTDRILELSSIKCGHVFCTSCITRALDKKRQCPICRSPAKIKHLRRIFLTF